MTDSPDRQHDHMIRLQQLIVDALRLADAHELYTIAASLDQARHPVVEELRRMRLDHRIIDVPIPDALS